MLSRLVVRKRLKWTINKIFFFAKSKKSTFLKRAYISGKTLQLDDKPKEQMQQLKGESIATLLFCPCNYILPELLCGHFKKQKFQRFWPFQYRKTNFQIMMREDEWKMDKGERLGKHIGRAIKCYINRSFSVGNIIVFKIVLKNMAYYIFINPGNNGFNTIEQFPSYYSSIPSLYPTSDDFISPSLYSFSWNQTEFLKPTQYTPTLITAVPAQNGCNISQNNSSASKQPKKKVQKKTLEKQILSAKKNSQSNIINQFYSYFGNRQKSEKILQRCYHLMGKSPQQFQKISSYFYTAIRLINAKRGRKYVNVAMFLRFFNSEELSTYLPEMEQKLASCEVLSMDELCEIIRRCCKHFLKNISPSAIMTSKRISIVSKEEHLKKRRKFLRSMLQI